ncbi:hypothetical protein ACQY0O_003962 [Thecaphora frezii]
MHSDEPPEFLQHGEGAAAAATEGSETLDDLTVEAGRAPIMSVHIQKKRLGCAVMQWQEQRVLLLEGVELERQESQPLAPASFASTDTGSEGGADDEAASEPESDAVCIEDHFDLLHMVILQYKPETILVSSQVSGSVFSGLQRSGDFSYAIGSVQLKALLHYSPAGSRLRDSAELQARTHASSIGLSSRVDLVRSRVSVAAAAPILQMAKADRDMPTSVGVDTLFLDNILSVPDDTIQALSIFDIESHASLHTKQGREGLSVLTLLSLNSSRHSQYLLRQWLMFPLGRVADIEERLDAVEALAREERQNQLADLRAQLSILTNVPRLVVAMVKGLNSLSSWFKLFQSCQAILRATILLAHSDVGKARLLQQLRDRVDHAAIEAFAQRVSSMIDWEDSKAQGRVTLQRGFDAHLDELRDAYAGLPDLLDRVAMGLRNEPAFSQTTRCDYGGDRFVDRKTNESFGLHVVYFPQIGYLIVVPVGEAVESQYDPTLTPQFTSDASVYLKNEKMADLDQHLGDLASFIVDREIELLEDLQELLAATAQSLLRSAEAMMVLDCLMALARAANLYGYTRK